MKRLLWAFFMVGFMVSPVWADTIFPNVPVSITGGNALLAPDNLITDIKAVDAQGNRFDFPAADQNGAFGPFLKGYQAGTTSQFSQLIQIDACCGGFTENGTVIARLAGATNITITGSFTVAPGTGNLVTGSGLAEFSGFAVAPGPGGNPDTGGSTPPIHYTFDEPNVPFTAVLQSSGDGLYHVESLGLGNPNGGGKFTFYDQTASQSNGGGGITGPASVGSPSTVPEPATLLLLGSGLAGLAWRRQKA